MTDDDPKVGAHHEWPGFRGQHATSTPISCNMDPPLVPPDSLRRFAGTAYEWTAEAWPGTASVSGQSIWGVVGRAPGVEDERHAVGWGDWARMIAYSLNCQRAAP